MDFCALHSRYCRCDSQSLTSFLIPICEKKTVNLISGFLGAGKTTMVNQILQQPTNKRIVAKNDRMYVFIISMFLKMQKYKIIRKSCFSQFADFVDHLLFFQYPLSMLFWLASL